VGGIVTFPGVAYYHASKFALEGLFESLGKEVAPFGIRVTCIEPGRFRTDWAGRSMVRSERRIADYDAIMNPVRRNRLDGSGKQPGDPRKAAQAMLRFLEMEQSAAHLLLAEMR
jgi:NAD(P)-dependent dehydrogenase (short-subunit alcohol dehydrogenase family)